LVLSHGIPGSLLDDAPMILSDDSKDATQEFAVLIVNVERLRGAFQVGAGFDEPSHNVRIVGVLAGGDHLSQFIRKMGSQLPIVPTNCAWHPWHPCWHS
jgi:hypothetical protein